MSGAEDELTCRRCGRPVRVHRDDYETFQRMHYVCFHYAFEHEVSAPGADPDEACGLAGCPSASAGARRERVVAIVRGLCVEWSGGEPADWENVTVPRYLGALAAWLEDADGYYANRGVPVPWNGWEVLADAVRAAAVYE